MHNAFKIKHPLKNCSYIIFYKLFIQSFKLKFQQPYIDLCDKCAYYNNKIISSSNFDRKNVKLDLKKHIDLADNFYKAMKLDQAGNTCNVSFDLQKMLPLPP